VLNKHLQTAIDRYKNILFLASEERLENPLETLLFMLYRDGVFAVTVGGNVMENIVIDEQTESWFQRMRLHAKDYVWRPLCSTSVFGYMEVRDRFTSLPSIQRIIIDYYHHCIIERVCDDDDGWWCRVRLCLRKLLKKCTVAVSMNSVGPQNISKRKTTTDHSDFGPSIICY
jgi:hypothetical protein